MIERSLRRVFRREEGQGLIEISFLLPFFLVMVVGVIEVADGMNAYITLIDSARDGARLGSKNLATDEEIKNLIMIETDRLRDDVTTDDITVSYITLAGENAIRVEVCNDRTLLMDIPLVMPESFRMCSKTTMRLLPGYNNQGGPAPTSTPTPGTPVPTDTPVPTNTPAPTDTPTNTPVPTDTPVAPTPTPDSCPWWEWWC